MITYNYMISEVMAGPVSFSYWKGEVEELREELSQLNWRGVREEWSDVSCMGMLMLVERIPILGVLPILPGLGLLAAKKFDARRAVWARIFKRHGVEFHRRYLIHGGNYAKLEKIKTALSLGGYKGEIDEDWLRGQGIIK